MENIGEYIKNNVLPQDLEGLVCKLGELAPTRRQKRRIKSIVKGLTLEMPTHSGTVAGVFIGQRKIVLPYGFLRARWCSTYQVLGLLKGAKGYEAFKEASPVGGIFEWSRGVPTPDQNLSDVADTNKIYPYVILTTILHEIGHLIHRGRCAPARRIELACDGFAMDYLIRCKRNDALDALALGLGVWVCGMCSESLQYTEFTSKSHPSPARRMEQLFSRHLSRMRGGTMSKIRFWCVSHLVNLAKIRREEKIEEVIERDFESLVARVHALRKCWGPLA